MISSTAAGLISVVIPVHDQAAYIGEALASVYGQDVQPLDVIVVDDGSSDGSLATAQARYPAIRAIRQDNAGIGAARNRGVEAARGEYLAFLDADDRWPAGSLSRLLAALAELTAPAMAFGHLRHFLCPSLDQESRDRLHCPAGTAPGYFAGAMLIRLDDFRRVGPFEEDLRVGEFVGWLARARDRGLAQAMVEDVVLERRIHLANHTLQWRDSFGSYAQMLKRTIDRRRSGTES
jgi:glycosyltransferase involved in cell wall biosynthesis